ncbi:AAA family ATPase [Tichowtungia aerotolerans]|uniref:AAA domain-containing protein n=1 Tax=Tichowtungia aerotolerans TaxID=2697043 RepID=A0A6P1MBY2_9BACT|nr:AAA family ATPase [Tichowtungia aerotolerans]QHI68605.1 AAA domain-containing protein [Tichowtungia aerotolerans]
MQERLPELNKKLDAVRTSIAEVIVGQQALIDKLLNALLCNGHVLLEGVPGVAKTMMVNSMANALDASFNRLQFTPDLLPGDVVGTQIYRDGTFETERGPIFANLVLADEINRAPAKVQSALLEAMQEHQVTLGQQTHKLPEPFMVLATQNPIEQEGTYALPEAQVDRFIFKLIVDYPTMDEEHIILRRMAKTAPKVSVTQAASLEDILELRRHLDAIHVDEKIERYILRLVAATRDPSAYGLDELKGYIRFGASPRASIYLALAARGHALLRGGEFVVPDDVKAVLHDVVRHRIAISYRAEAEGLNSDAILERIVETVPVTE